MAYITSSYRESLKHKYDSGDGIRKKTTNISRFEGKVTIVLTNDNFQSVEQSIKQSMVYILINICLHESNKMYIMLSCDSKFDMNVYPGRL